MPCEAHRILWTGGWDSTFRVLYLALHGSRQIQPYYLYFEMRRSSALELEAIELIQKLFRERFPQAARRITRPIVIKVDGLPQNEELHQAYITLRNKSYLGDQYLSIADFATRFGLRSLELCIHKDDRAHMFIKDSIKQIQVDREVCYEIREDAEPEVLKIFGHFRFSILHLSKTDMSTIADINEFKDLLERTWFCHSPTRNNQPCGICNPCGYAIQEGMAYRLPMKSLFFYYLNQLSNIMARPIPKQTRQRILFLYSKITKHRI